MATAGEKHGPNRYAEVVTARANPVIDGGEGNPFKETLFWDERSRQTNHVRLPPNGRSASQGRVIVGPEPGKNRSQDGSKLRIPRLIRIGEIAKARVLKAGVMIHRLWP